MGLFIKNEQAKSWGKFRNWGNHVCYVESGEEHVHYFEIGECMFARGGMPRRQVRCGCPANYSERSKSFSSQGA